MNDEERQRTMDFILQQQAKTDARLDRMAERDAEADARLARFDTRLARLERVLKLAIRAGIRERREWRERHAALVDAQIRTEDSMRELRAVTQRNGEDINRLAKIVERNITGQNGGGDAG